MSITSIKPCAVMIIMFMVIVFPSYSPAVTGQGHEGHDMTGHSAPSHDKKNVKPNEKKKKIRYWVAPMDPNYIRHEPGKSPMGMDLVPVYEDEAGRSSEGGIVIDPVTVQNTGIRTAIVTSGHLHTTIRAVGRITYDEKRVEHIHTKISGWVEKLYIDTTGEKVRKGDALLSLYSPELVATQEEFLQAMKYREQTASSGFAEISQGGASLVEAARKRLMFMDIEPGQIRDLEESRTVQKNMKIYSLKNGIVINKNVIEGMKVDPSMELYTIADLSKVWMIASIYEYELPFIKTGIDAEMTLSYDPGIRHKGKVTFIYPFLSNKTRTVQVRMEFDNPDMKLKPDMYADVVIKARTDAPAHLVPSEAVIRTGTRNVVITSPEKGRFLPREVTTGLEGEGLIQILKGLEKGETIVTSGQFLIDSESNLREAVNKMLEIQASGSSAKDHTGMSDAKMNDHKEINLSALIESYLRIHDALVSESMPEVVEETRILSDNIKKIRHTDPEKKVSEIIARMNVSLTGLLSGDLKQSREAFKTLSRSMMDLIKGPGRESALSSEVKLYHCPMEKEYWIQKGTEMKNPYMGEAMFICGTEEKF